MKKTIFMILLTAFVLIFLSGYGYCKQKTIYVSNTEELLKAIGSDREIVVEEHLTLTAQNQSKPLNFGNKHIHWEEELDGYALYIRDVKNLTIKGSQKVKYATEILTAPRYVFVMTFENSHDITIEELSLGHTPVGKCSGGVLLFKDCSNIKIQQSKLFGCGTDGLILENVKNFKAVLSEIYNCNQLIMRLNNSSDILFEKCSFYENASEFELGGFRILGCNNVTFNRPYILRNSGKYLFYEKDSSNIKVIDATFENNKFIALDPKTFVIVYKDCKFGKGNTFETDGFRINKNGYYDGFTISE